MTHVQRAPINHDLLCVRCGYNLRGLDRDRVCPECGVPIEASCCDHQLIHSDPDWVATLAQGAWWMVVGLTVWMLILAVAAAQLMDDWMSFLHLPDDAWWVSLITVRLVANVVYVIGIWKLTTREPVRGRVASAAVLARWTHVVWLAIDLCWFGAAWAEYPDAWVLLCLGLTMYVPAIMTGLMCVSHLVGRMQRQWEIIAAVLFAAVLLYPSFAAFLLSTERAALIAVAVIGAWLLWGPIHFRFAILLHRAAEQARVHRNLLGVPEK